MCVCVSECACVGGGWGGGACMRAYVRVCVGGVRACVRTCVCVCVRACVCAYVSIYICNGAEWSKDKTQAAESIKWRPQQA